MTELKKCPLCGSDVIRIKSDRILHLTSIHCSNCGILRLSEETEGVAIKAWNNRPLEQELQKKIVELEQEAIQKILGDTIEDVVLVEKLQAENAELKKQMEWRDISTAPDDGREILLHRGELMTKALHVILSFTCIGYNCCGHYGEEQFRDTKSNFVQPTHWMPLPTPPKEI